MQQKKSYNFGFRGWMLIVYQFLAYLTMVVFTNWPMNALGDMYGGGQVVSTIFTAGMVLGVIFQLIIGPKIGRVKNIKVFSIVQGVICMVFALGIMFIPPSMLIMWQICYFLECFTVAVWCTYILGILVGQWFPRRKGTVMGIVTVAFPLGNALMSPFAAVVFANMATTHVPDVVGGFMPFFIIICLGILIGAIFVKDYPEQCGAYRDNDKSLTPEVAQKMMKEEIENKKNSSWTFGRTLATPDFWLIGLPLGFILMAAVGTMTQTTTIIGTYGYDPQTPEFGLIMLAVSIAAIIGSVVLGLLDTRFGTKRAVIITACFMVVSGIFGMMGSLPTLITSLILLGVFMGASSNFMVSASVQYWRREDFANVFSRVNPLANLMQALAPMILAAILFSTGFIGGVTGMFGLICAFGVISLILVLLFKPSRIKVFDDKYRKMDGKPLDDALVGRK